MPAVVLAVRIPTSGPDANFVVDPAPADTAAVDDADEIRVVGAADDTFPLATFPRRIDARAGDGRAWELLTSRAGVEVLGEAGRLAEAQVAEESDRVVVDIRPAVPGLPADIGALLVGQAFAHPAVRAERPILVTMPRGESTVLEEVRAHLEGARARVAGVTCLVEGRVRTAVR